MSKQLPVKKEWPYNQIGSFNDVNPYTICFVYPQNKEAFVLKGGIIDIRKYLDGQHYPYIAHKTFWRHGEKRGYIDIQNLTTGYKARLSRCGTRHNIYYKFEIIKVDTIPLNGWYSKEKCIFEKFLNRIPRKWMVELDQYTDIENHTNSEERKPKKLYHWCTDCKDIVAMKLTQPFMFYKSQVCKCGHKNNWKRIYI